MYFGKFGLLFGPPKPCQLSVVIGTPIKVPKVLNPNVEQMTYYQDILISEINKLFECHKDAHGMSDINLKII